MLRTLFTLSLLAVAVPAEAGGPQVNKNGAGPVLVEARGKLVQKERRHYVLVRNAPFDDDFLLPLARSEDKDRQLDQRLAELEGKVVSIRGVLRYHPTAAYGPKLLIDPQWDTLRPAADK